MDRRRFLAFAGLAGAGITLGGGRAALATTSKSGTAAGMEHMAAGPSVDFVALRKALTGTLLLPGDGGYPVAAQPYNAALGVRRPVAIARVANTADVVTCVRRAGGRGLPLAARSGGHSYAGWSTPDHGVVVDLSALR